MHDSLLSSGRTECAGLNWAAPSSTFPKFTQLLRQRTYTYSVLLGMTVSVGGLTESLVKHSAHSMLDYLRSIRRDVSELRAFSDVLLQVFRDYSRVDRSVQHHQHAPAACTVQ